MAAITEYDFSKCRYNPREAGFVSDMAREIPEFRVTKVNNRKQVFTYIIAMYDKESPLQRRFLDYYERKIRSAEIASLPNDGRGGFGAETKEIMEGRHEEVNKLIVAYVANTGDIEYMMLINEWAMFQGYTTLTLSGAYDDKTFKILNDISKSIKDRTRSVFGSGEHDELAMVRTLLYEMAEKDRHRLNIENVVRLVSENGDVPPAWNPYGDYSVDDLKFLDNK